MKKTILICDDDKGILEVVKIVLEDKGYNVISLSEAEKVQDTVIKLKPDLILLDLWMPNLNGDTITQTLKDNKNTNHIPIIVISANKDTATIAQKVQADSFLTKPFNIDELERIVERFL